MADLGTTRKKRLHWLCRRGTRELDKLALGYLEHCYAGATPAQQDAFERMLQLPDPDLYDLLIGRCASDDMEMNEVAECIRENAEG